MKKSPARISCKNNLLLPLAVSALALLAASAAHAQAVTTWNNPVTVSGDTDVSTNGKLVYAYCLSDISTNVNGVPFTGVTSIAATGGNVAATGINTPLPTTFGQGTGLPWAGFSPAYQAILEGAEYEGGATTFTLTLNNLSYGHQYAAQFWVGDWREYTNPRTETISGSASDNMTPTLSFLTGNGTLNGTGTGTCVVGTFAAFAPSQVFTLVPNQSGQINAIQLRDLGLAGSVGTGFWNGLTGSAWDSNTTANWCLNNSAFPLTNGTFNAAMALSGDQAYFNDAYYSNSVAFPVTRTNLTVAAGGISATSVNFVGASLDYAFNSADAAGITGATALNLLIAGAASVTLSGANTYSGGTTLGGGKLNLNNASAIGSGPLTISGGALDNTSGSAIIYSQNNAQNWNGNFAVAGTTNLDLGTGAVMMNASPTITVISNVFTVDGIVDDGGSGFTLTKAGAGTLTLTGTNTYSGGTTITAGTLNLTGAHSSASGTGFYLQNTCTVNITGTESITGAGWFFPGNGTAGTATVNVSGTLNISGSAGTILGQNHANDNGILNILNGGVVNVSESYFILGNNSATANGTLNMAPGSALNFTDNDAGSLDGFAVGRSGAVGTVNLNGGTITTMRDITHGNGTPGISAFNFNGGTLASAENSTTFMTVTAANVLAGGAIIDDGGFAITISPALLTGGAGNDGGLTKLGSGTLTLSGASTYTGATTVSNGTLALTGSLASTNIVIPVNSATFDVSGAVGGYYLTSGQTLKGVGTVIGPMIVNSGATLTVAGASGTTTGTLTTSGNLTLAGTAVLRINKTGKVLASDAIAGFASLIYGGTLTVNNITSDSTALASGDTFTLFPKGAGSYAGGFAAFNLPALPAGLFWDTSELDAGGAIKVTTVNIADAPSFSPPSGDYIGAQTVTISSPTTGATIYYTTNGSTPTTSSASGVTPVSVIVPVNTRMTIQAFAGGSGFTDSPTNSATYGTVSTPIWINTAGGSWPVATNWSNNVVANGGGITADFSQLTLASDTYVTLDSPITIGNLILGDAGNAYTWEIDAGSGGPLTLMATNRPNIMVLNQTATIGAALVAANGLTKTGNGTLVLDSAGYIGNTIVSNGTLSINQGTSFESPNVTVNSGATLNFNTAGGPAPSSAVFIEDNQEVSHAGAGVVMITGSGYNAFAGNSSGCFFNMSPGAWFDVQSSDIQFGWNYLSFGSNLGSLNVASGASYHNSQIYQSGTIQFDSLTGAGTVGNGYSYVVTLTLGVNNNSNSLAYGVSNNAATFSGSITDHENYNGVATGNLNLVKVGAGTQILSGLNSYSGSTTVSGGTLVMTNGIPSTAPVTVSAGGTLVCQSTISGSVTVQGGGTLALGGAGAGAGVGTLDIIGALALNAGGTDFMRITKTGGSPASDTVQASPVTYGGTLVVTNITTGGTPLALGDTFHLFGGTFNGTFVNFILPALPSGLSWDVSQLTANGTIAVVNYASTPAFNPPTGNYVGAQSVTISSLTPGATIYYTTNGSTPSTSSPHGASGVTVAVPVNTTNLMIQAMAVAAGQGNSAVASATYSTEAKAVWINLAGGSWETPGDWTNNIIPNNSGAMVDFSQLTLTTNTYVTLDEAWIVGDLIFGDAGNLYPWELDAGANGALTLAASNTPAITVSNQTTTITAPISGVNGLLKTGAGTLMLSGANSYSGGTTISQGILEIGNLASSGTGSVTLGDAKTGTNNIQLAIGTDNYISPINVSTNGTGLATISFTVTINHNYSALTLNRPVTINATSALANLLGPITGNVGTLTFNGPSGGAVAGMYNMPNTFTGTIVLASGEMGSFPSSFGAANPVVMQQSGSAWMLEYSVGGEPNVPGGTTTIGSLTGQGTIEAAGTSEILSLGNDNGSGAYSGVIADGGGTMTLIKSGSGIESLSGANTYSGPTTVSGGILVVSGSIGTGAVTVQSGGILGGNGTIGGATTIQSGGTLSVFNGSSNGTLTINNTLTLAGGSATTIAINNAAAANDSLAGISTLTYGGTLTVVNLGGPLPLAAGNSFKLFSATTYAGNFAATVLPALGSGLVWNWTPTNGTLAVVTGVAPPVLSGTAALKGTSFSLSFSGASGQGYTVLMTTNLALPLADWTPLTNGTFGASPADFTDTGATNAARFYRIMSP